MLNKSVLTNDLFEKIPPELKLLFDKYDYPWQILPELKEFLASLAENPPEGYRGLADGVIVGQNVEIHPTAVIMPPTVIGDGTQIRPGAYIRGSVFVGKRCVIGNSSEIKNSVIFDHAEVPHYNYVGDSVLGEHAHMGAGAICSNLKSGGGNITVHAESDYETGLRKFGAVLADGADIGCGSVLNPGTVIGKNTNVYPLTMLRGVYPADSIVKSADNVVKKT